MVPDMLGEAQIVMYFVVVTAWYILKASSLRNTFWRRRSWKLEKERLQLLLRTTSSTPHMEMRMGWNTQTLECPRP